MAAKQREAKPAIDPDKLYRIKDAATYLDVDYMTLWRWIKRGKVQGHQVAGSTWRITGSAILDCMESTGSAAKSTTTAAGVAAGVAA